ncbi:MAG: CBS domain-containing protein [Bdellovibrio sp.]|nr:CBS domain-containing protein [Bdellovibrio sp.]
MNRNILVLNKHTSVRTAARALFERQTCCVVASDDHGHIVGLVTDRDLTCLVLGFEMPDTTPISDVMATEIFTVERKSQIYDVVKLMEDNGVRRIPVVEKIKNGHQKCIGIYTLDDLIVSEIVHLKFLAQIVRAQKSSRNLLTNASAIYQNAHDHVLNRFYKIMAEAMNLPRSTAELVSMKLLTRIVQRLPQVVSLQFISQLPTDLQKELVKISNGPDSNIDEHVILSDLTQGFQMLHAESLLVTKKFWLGLNKFLDPNVMAQTLQQMPESVAEIFTGTEWGDDVTVADSFDLD